MKTSERYQTIDERDGFSGRRTLSLLFQISGCGVVKLDKMTSDLYTVRTGYLVKNAEMAEKKDKEKRG